MQISKITVIVAAALLTLSTLPSMALTSHGAKKRHHHAAKALPPVQPSQAPLRSNSDNAAENGIGGAGTLDSGGLSFLGPARGGIGH